MAATEKRKMTVYLEEDVYKKLMHHSIDVDRSASSIVEELVVAYLKNLQSKRG